MAEDVSKNAPIYHFGGDKRNELQVRIDYRNATKKAKKDVKEQFKRMDQRFSFRDDIPSRMDIVEARLTDLKDNAGQQLGQIFNSTTNDPFVGDYDCPNGVLKTITLYHSPEYNCSGFSLYGAAYQTTNPGIPVVEQYDAGSEVRAIYWRTADNKSIYMPRFAHNRPVVELYGFYNTYDEYIPWKLSDELQWRKLFLYSGTAPVFPGDPDCVKPVNPSLVRSEEGVSQYAARVDHVHDLDLSPIEQMIYDYATSSGSGIYSYVYDNARHNVLIDRNDTAAHYNIYFPAKRLENDWYCNDTFSVQNNITSYSGNIYATTGNVCAGNEITSVGRIYSGSDIVAVTGFGTPAALSVGAGIISYTRTGLHDLTDTLYLLKYDGATGTFQPWGPIQLAGGVVT